ncbi:7-carboxy-7-deazaguanine synthase [archaeon HR06]|nr:7-carboxy-7-deazaguanine synthase [archaeon HR06]
MLRKHLPWYYSVALNEKPAKYLICKRIKCDLDLQNATKEEMLKEHERLSKEFQKIWMEIREEKLNLKELEVQNSSFLDLKVRLVYKILEMCEFCRWHCKVNRVQGNKFGTCQLEDISRVGCYFHHFGEELPIRGQRGSGTIFFTSCNMRCVFCQNGDISHDKFNGIAITPEQLALMMYQLRMEGCHNINFVGGEPTIHLHTIVKAISLLDFKEFKEEDLIYISQVKSDFYFSYKKIKEQAFYNGEFNVPLLWNSNFYMSEVTMKILREIIDIYLPDFKFGNDKCAIKLSKTPWYFETVSKNHRTVYEWGDDMVIRHLIMPNHVECCTKPVLDWIAKNMPDVLLNIMDQFHPDYACDPFSEKFDKRYCELARRPSEREIKEAYSYAKSLGLNFELLSYEKSVYGYRV